MNYHDNKKKTCIDKKAYITELEALHWAIHDSRKYGGSMKPYKCPYCGRYHLTSQVDKDVC